MKKRYNWIWKRRKEGKEDVSSYWMALRRKRGYWKLKDELLDRALWRTRFGRDWIWCTEYRIMPNNRNSVGIRQHRWAFMQPLLQSKNNGYYTTWVCVCSLRCPECNAQYFSSLSHKRQRFKKKLLNTKHLFWFFSTTFIPNASHSE